MDVWCSSFFRVPGNIIRKWAEDKRNEGVLQLVITLLYFICPQGHFLAALHICLSISHPTVAHFSRCQCGLAVWEWAHCSLWYISRYCCRYHVREWNSHIERSFPPFPCCTQRQMGIVMTRDGFWTLANIVIADLTHTDLVQQIWWSVFWQQHRMQQQLLLKTRHNPTQSDKASVKRNL